MSNTQSWGKVGFALSIVAIIVAVGFHFYPTNNGKPTVRESAVDHIVANKKFRVGYVKFAPCADTNPQTNELQGIFIDAMREIAADMKLEVEFKETTLATFSAALEADEFDFSVGPTFITPTRSIAVDFTKPILALGNSGLVKKADQAKFASMDDLGRSGVKIAVLQGQAMEQFVKSRYPNANLIVISGSDLTAPLLAVESGQADIGLSNSVTVQEYARSHAETAVVYTNENSLVRLGLAWVVRKGDDKTRSFLNSSIDWLVQSGKLDTIQDKYDTKLAKLKY